MERSLDGGGIHVLGRFIRPDVPVSLGPNALAVLEKRYLLKDEHGRPAESACGGTASGAGSRSRRWTARPSSMTSFGASSETGASARHRPATRSRTTPELASTRSNASTSKETAFGLTGRF